MEVVVDVGGGNGIFAGAVNADGGMVVAASTTAAQLTMTTAIAAAAISHQCHCIIVSPSHCRLHWQQLLLTKTTIAVATINHCFCRQWPALLPATTNNHRWLLAIVVVDCVAAAMAVINGGNSSHCWQQQWWDWVDGTDGGVVNCGGSW
jgi:hypothetical protein